MNMEHKIQITTREGEIESGIPAPENIDAITELKQMRDSAIAKAMSLGLPFAKIEQIENMTEQELREYLARPDKNVR